MARHKLSEFEIEQRLRDAKKLTFGRKAPTYPAPVGSPLVVGQPDDQLGDRVDDQSTADGKDEPSPLLVPQSPSRPADEYTYPSRIRRRKKGIRLPSDKLQAYEDWQHARRDRFPSFQDAVEYAMDQMIENWGTSRPGDQSPALINKSNKQLVIKDEKAKKVLARFTELTRRAPSQNDVDAYGEVAHVDLGVILREMGEIKARADRANSPVNGFRYFVRDVLKAAQVVAASVEEKRDTSACPDCGGSGFYYPQGTDKGVSKCKHDRLTS